MVKPTLHCPCKGQYLEHTFQYDAPPEGETRFNLGDQVYDRAYNRCRLCGHWFAYHDMDLDELYGGTYVDNTYGTRLQETFERIITLPPERSDNAGRAERVAEFATKHFGHTNSLRLLDVGSGLGVFPFVMKQRGWHCTALDPDERAAQHIRDVVGVDTIAGDFMSLDIANKQKFDMITFNKVLEHVEDPVSMLRQALSLLTPDGLIYIEVPDGEAAATVSLGREEFFIEHHHVFSPTSATLMTIKAGFELLLLERLQEASTKFTLRLFIKGCSSV